jgi:DNA-binding MarR family transcriptional regulator
MRRVPKNQDDPGTDVAAGRDHGALAADLSRTITRLYTLLREPLLDLDVAGPRGRVLADLNDRGPRRISQLSFRHNVSQPTMTALVTGLERRGWARREADPTDGRAVLVHLTATGSEILRAARRAKDEALADHLRGLGHDTIESLSEAVTALRRLVEVLERPS